MAGHDTYVLVTAAYNEEKFIEETIRSVVRQQIRPAKWIIVSDGSTDKTDSLVKKFAARHDFIQLHRIKESHSRNFAAQANAINTGIAQLQGMEYEFIGNLDADVSFEPAYFAKLLETFRQTSALGLAGGFIHERDQNGEFRSRKLNSVASVAHACQLFRRECFASVGGGYLPLPHGGPDTYAETMARMKGWRVEAFPELRVLHHRPTGSAGGALPAWFRQGRMDHSLGALPLFELFKLARRVRERPSVTGALARLAGFGYGYFRRESRPVSNEFVAYLRGEQRQRLNDLFRNAELRQLSH